jgi:uncharacterized protein
MQGRPSGPAAVDVAAALRLEPHPEGGYFRETYRSAATVQTGRGERSLATAILFLVTADRPSRLHRLTSDELWIHQGGAALELLLIDADGGLRRRLLSGTAAGVGAGGKHAGLDGEPQALVPAGVWQAARLAGGSRRPDVTPDGAGPAGAGTREEGDVGLAGWSLVTCVVTPGFDYADFELGEREELLRTFPHLREAIVALT